MLRKKPSIHTVNLISSSIPRVISSFSSSHNKTLIPALKTSPWVHHLRRSSTAAAQRFDFFPVGLNSVESDIGPRNQLQQQNPSGFYGENYSGNSVRYQRSDFGGFQPPNPTGVYRGSSDSYQKSDLGDARSVNPDGFSRENSVGYPTNNIGMVHRNSGFHGEFSHGGNTREGQNSGFHGEFSHGGNAREGQNSGFRGEFSHGGNTREVQNSGFHGGNTREGQNSGFHGEFSHGGNAGEGQNSSFRGEFSHGGNTREGQNPGFHGELSHGGNTREDHFPIPMETYRQSPGNSGQLQQSPFGQNGYQNSYGYNRANVIPGGQQDFGETPFSVPNINSELPNHESAQNSEICSYKCTLDELDEFSNEAKVKEAVEVLNLLEKKGVVIDLPRYLKLLKVCGDAGSLEEGRIVHDHISRVLGELGIGVHNKILDMYSKCGSMDDAFQLFNSMPQRNLTSWDTMITGLANNNLGEEAIDLFLQFNEMGLRADEDLFVAVFRACGVLGAVKEGMLHFDSMKVHFGIVPTMKHYVSIVDMLGRSGHLDEALEFIEMMPIEPSCDVWETLMYFCRVNGYEELGNRCAEIVEDHDSSKLTEESKKGFLTVKTSTGAKTESAKKSNLLSGRSQIHEYRAGDRSNPEIYEQIKILVPHMKEAGYVPDIKCVLHDVDEESREEALLFHSERLATAYGLMTSSVRSPIRIIKNLRVCRDCHNAMKIMSKIVGRLLIARDAKRFHHFENGVCSCKDFW